MANDPTPPPARRSTDPGTTRPAGSIHYPSGRRRVTVVQVTYEGDADWVQQTLSKSLKAPYRTPYGEIRKVMIAEEECPAPEASGG